MEITRKLFASHSTSLDPWFLHRMCLVFREWIAPMICGWNSRILADAECDLYVHLSNRLPHHVVVFPLQMG